MSKDNDNKKQTVYNQVAWILNYQPKIEHQHIHMGNQQESDETADVDNDDTDNIEIKEERTVKQSKPQKLDMKTPESKLILLLSRNWFTECTTDEKIYTQSWRSKYIKSLIEQFGEQIAKGWVGVGTRNKQNLIKAHVIGALKKAGVIKGSYTDIARKLLNRGVPPTENEVKALAAYMGHPQGNEDESKQNPYSDWTAEYVKGTK